MSKAHLMFRKNSKIYCKTNQYYNTWHRSSSKIFGILYRSSSSNLSLLQMLKANHCSGEEDKRRRLQKWNLGGPLMKIKRTRMSYFCMGKNSIISNLKIVTTYHLLRSQKRLKDSWSKVINNNNYLKLSSLIKVLTKFQHLRALLTMNMN